MKLRKVGFVSVVSGIFLMLATTPVITGFAILENFQGSLIVRLVSIVLMIGGVVLLASERKDEKSELEKLSNGGFPIIESKRFIRSIKRHNEERIYRAISKIGTGLADAHPLTGDGEGYWAIRVSGGARIIYHVEEGNLFLDSYTSDHDYDKVLRSLPRRKGAY
jgi:mRNA-degrading endonuclease YafQ of YafQ-DinJ toxin-antitoxin module